jgi:putative endonuclease
MNTKKFGDYGEQIAVEYLKSCGFKILERNFKACGSEADIICELTKPDGISEKGTIVFVEVKNRSHERFGLPSEAVGTAKRRQYLKAANAYIVLKKKVNTDIRFDVIEIIGREINHIKAAFSG